MLIYFVVLVVVTMALHLAGRARDKAESFFMYSVTFVSLVLIGALRSGYVGTDSGYYIMHFEGIERLAGVWRGGVEPGVLLLSWLGKQVYNDYIALFTLVAIVTTLCFLQGIRRLSVNPTLSFFVLLTSGVYYFSFNGTRQGIAIAICFLAISAIHLRKFWVFLVLVAVACLFHTSAAVVLPAYFMVPQENDLKRNIVLFSLVGIALFAFSWLVNTAGRVNPRALGYATSVETGRGLVQSAFYFTLGAFFLFFKRHVQEHRSLYSLLLNVYLLGMIVVLTSVIKSTGGSGILRLSNYFTVSQVLLWPIVFANLKDNARRGALLSLFGILYLVYHYMTLQAFSNLTPYTFNPLVQNWFSSLF
jgi:hypothetical protein